MYEDSIVPEYLPGGGGFAVMKFTLYNLYDMHEKCENWWTASNDNLPLCRYQGCKLKLYQSDTVDWILNVQNNGPFVSNKLSYPSCHPFMLLMNSHKHIIPSRQTKPWKRPYKKIFIPPADQFMNKWYFQKDICNLTLLTLHASVCSLLHTFIDTKSESNNISIKHLNTTVFRNRDWGNKKWKTEHWPYKGEGTQATYFYRYGGTENTEDKMLVKDICPLTDPQTANEGQTFTEASLHNRNYTAEQYKQNLLKHRGNIFLKNHFTQQESIYISTISPQALFNTFSSTNKDTLTVKQAETPHTRSFTEFTENMYTYTRYNPNTDNGETTQMYLLDNNTTGVNYEPPEDETKILSGYPLWLNIYGFTDFQIKLQKYINITQNYLLVIKTKATKPLQTQPLVIIDQYFIDGQSPYRPHIEYIDSQKWYPQLEYQESTINDIGTCGPGIAKMGDRHSEEVKIKYEFLFKWGGNPAKMITVDNPTEQIIYPIPRNERETTSLQSPANSFETILYTFDQRNHQLTSKALERISNNLQTKEPLLSITDPTTTTALQTLQELLQETQTEEESEKALLQQLHQQRQQQLQLQLRIMDLLKTMPQ